VSGRLPGIASAFVGGEQTTAHAGALALSAFLGRLTVIRLQAGVDVAYDASSAIAGGANWMPTPRPKVIPYLFYEDVPAALEFPARAFDLTEEMRHATPSGSMHAEMRLGVQRIMMGGGGSSYGMCSARQVGAATMGVFVYLETPTHHIPERDRPGRRINRSIR